MDKMITLEELDARCALLAYKIDNTDPYDYYTMRDILNEVTELKQEFTRITSVNDA